MSKELENNSTLSFLNASSHSRKDIGSFKRPNLQYVSSLDKYLENPNLNLSFNWHLQEARLSFLLQNRRSLRKFAESDISIQDLSYLLWATHGITAKVGKHHFRTSPSAGALFPYNIFLYINKVENLKQGIYVFHPELFNLFEVKMGDFSNELASCCMNQKFLSQAAVTFIWTGLLPKGMNKYGERALRYMLLDLGHASQNLLLAAEALGCGGCPVAAFFDDELNRFLELDQDVEPVLYITSIGLKRKK